MCCRVPWCGLVLQRIPATAVSLTEFSVYSSERSWKFSNCRKQRNKKNYQKIPKILKNDKKDKNTNKKYQKPKKNKKKKGKKNPRLLESTAIFSESPEILFFFGVLIFFVFLVFFEFLCVFFFFFFGLYFRLLMCFNTYFYCFLIWL